jgi:hypothetical protein
MEMGRFGTNHEVSETFRPVGSGLDWAIAKPQNVFRHFETVIGTEKLQRTLPLEPGGLIVRVRANYVPNQSREIGNSACRSVYVEVVRVGICHADEYGSQEYQLRRVLPPEVLGHHESAEPHVIERS